MAKAKKKPEPKKERTPDVLMIDNRFMTPEAAQRLLDARRASPDKRGEINKAFDEEMTAKALTLPEVRAARVIQRFEGSSLDVNQEVDELRRMTSKVNKGDMSTPEAMLVSQAHTLDALFSSMAMRAHSNMKEGYLEASDRYLRLALKAQAQATRTIEALAALKNPPIVYARNANVVNGPQQVNQTVTGGNLATSTHTHTGNFKSEPNELAAGGGYELLENARTSSHEGATNPAMEALGTLDRAAHIGR